MSDSEAIADAAQWMGLALVVAGHAIKAHSRSCWVKPHLQKRKQLGLYQTLLQEFRIGSIADFKRKLRMSPPVFDHLLSLVGPHIEKLDRRGDVISSAERLALTLRFVVSGNMVVDLADDFRVSSRSAHRIIDETLDVLYSQLQPTYMKCPETKREWLRIARRFYQKWGFPNALGGLDGKHIFVKSPRNSGSLFRNYKHRFSINLMALVDADYCFVFCDVGSYGRDNDSAVFKNSDFGEQLYDEKLPFQKATVDLPGSALSLPLVILADDAFQLSENLMKPYPGKSLSLEERIFSYRLSRGRRVSENAFGILRSRFRIFANDIDAKPSVIDKIIRASCTLHNFLKKTDQDHIYWEEGLQDMEDPTTGQVIAGSWRSETTGNEGLQAGLTGRLGSNHASRAAQNVRKSFTQYFMTPAGIEAAPWQFKYVQDNKDW